jgi:hypothetical protein
MVRARPANFCEIFREEHCRFPAPPPRQLLSLAGGRSPVSADLRYRDGVVTRLRNSRPVNCIDLHCADEPSISPASAHAFASHPYDITAIDHADPERTQCGDKNRPDLADGEGRGGVAADAGNEGEQFDQEAVRTLQGACGKWSAAERRTRRIC